MAKLKLMDLQSELTSEDWSAASNPISELSEKEQSTLLGANPPGGGPTKAEKTASKSLILNEMTASTREGAGRPAKVDWRNHGGKNFVTAVKNQGGCGSCVAFGTVGVLESMTKISKNQPNYSVDISEAHLFYCLKQDPNGCLNGWWPQHSFSEVKDHGVAQESFFPYTGRQQACNVRSGWQGTRTRIKDFKHISNPNAIKAWIAKEGPVSACYEVFEDFYAYRSGVYRHISGPSKGWHCVTVVGYNDTGGYWIAKNSWGTNWGDQGYFKIKYGECSFEHYGMWGVARKDVEDSKWITGKKVIGLWANNQNLNAFAYLEDEGWKKIANNNQENFFMLLTALVSAKNQSITPSVLIENGKIVQIYS